MLNSSFIAGHIFYTTLSSFLSENSSNYFIKICGVNKEGKKEITLNLVYFIFVLYYWSNVSVSRRFILSKIHPKLMHQHHSFLHFLPSSAVCSLCMAGSWGLQPSRCSCVSVEIITQAESRILFSFTPFSHMQELPLEDKGSVHKKHHRAQISLMKSVAGVRRTQLFPSTVGLLNIY